MVQHRVWVDSWQMQCCGEAFELGATVQWTVRPADKEWLASFLGAREASRFSSAENHHDDAGGRALTGRVLSIDAAYCRFVRSDPSSPLFVPLAASREFRKRSRVDGWEVEGDEVQFVGYAVDLEEESRS